MTALLRDALEKQSYGVSCAETGPEGLAMAMEHSFHAIVLDAMLPGMDGFRVARTLRNVKISTPILMLTALDAKEDVVRGLDNGVDDYLTKPFVFQELFARLRAVSRRQPVFPDRSFRVNDLELDPKAHSVSRGGMNIALTRTEFLILEFLMRNQGTVLDRQRIILEVWGHEETVENNTLDVFVMQLRSKIDGGFQNKLIQTVRGIGYKLGSAAG
jgi:DNA-binding response OmpR family regulator